MNSGKPARCSEALSEIFASALFLFFSAYWEHTAQRGQGESNAPPGFGSCLSLLDLIFIFSKPGCLYTSEYIHARKQPML